MEQELGAARPGWRRRGVLTAGFAGVAAVAAGSAAWMVRRPEATAAAPALPLNTAKITRQTLVDQRTVPGRLAYGAEHQVETPLEGIITWLPEVGSVVERGKVLLRINDLPVLLFFGEIPAYRELTTALKGNDVTQFEQNLKALGYSRFSESAVRRWQEDLGLQASGVVELGRVFYAPGPVRIAGHELVVGQRVSGAVLTFTATARMVTAELKAHEHELAKKGTQVSVALPSGKVVLGKVMAIRPVRDQGEPGQAAGLEVDVSLVDPESVSGVDDGPVNVRLVAGERKDVLVVPVGALLALAEGGFGLEIIDGASSRVVAVEAGLFANGSVEVSGPAIAEGMTVGMAQ
jgi:membrane fusion protein, multidrug efflux system